MNDPTSASGTALARLWPDRLRAWRLQGRVLTERYAACLRGDLGTLLVLIGQAPIIGWLCAIVWSSVETDTPSLHFVMSLTAVWFGCINACREIVKERAIFERERFFGLSVVPYVASKLLVLGLLGLLQVLLLQATVESSVGVRGPMLLHLLALWGAALCGTGLGLAVSAIASRQERAVAAVPLLLLPQILFSSFAIPEETFSNTVAALEKLMPVHWAYVVFGELAAAETDWWDVGLALLALAVYVVALAALTMAALLPRREVA